MKHPPLLPSLFAVILLAIVNLLMKGTHFGDAPMRDVLAGAVAIVSAGVMLRPLLKGEPQRVEAPIEEDREQRPTQDDLDLSA